MIFSHYKRLLTQRPLLTKATTAATLMAASDIASQTMENGDTTSIINWERTLHVAITGLIFTGPMTHGWYQLLEKRWVVVPTSATTTRRRSTAFSTNDTHLPKLVRTALAQQRRLGTKLILDALVFSPIAVAGYFGMRSLLERGWNVYAVQEKLQSLYLPALVSSWYFWPAANVINFTMVPLPFRVLYNNVLSFFWNSYLTRLNSKGSRHDSIVTNQSLQEEGAGSSESISTTLRYLNQ